MSLRQQVIVRVADETVIGHELMLAHPRETLGLMSDAGLLVDLDRYILDVALRQARLGHGMVFVNVTSELLMDESLPYECGDNLSGLVLEITERSRLDAEAVAAYLEPFRRCGLQVALDDFGDGFNGVSRWVALRPDFVKVCLSAGAEVWLPALLHVAEQMGSELVVERVETAAQHLRLKELGVAYGQGFYYGRPAPLEGGAA
ncbi:MAG: EAL domain-containing protein [Alicyclobacillus sp.]|nr:EAL domain-containing protein [Alicyclobacillus sp.]